MNVIEGYVNSSIIIEDVALEKVIKKSIGKECGVIKRSEALSVIILDAEQKGIKSLEGIQYLENLEEVHLNANNIIDVSPLSDLKKLKKVNLCFNKIENIEPLLSLDNIEYIDLDGNPVKYNEKLRERLKNSDKFLFD